MKIIEAMKKIKDLNRKAEDLKNLVAKYCCDLDFETAAYADQKGQVEGWIQSHRDVLKEVLRLRVAIQRTNLRTIVPIELGGIVVTKTIAEWIHRRRDLSKTEMGMWQSLTDKNLKEGIGLTTTGEKKEIRIRRYYETKTRDTMLDLLRSEPVIIDGALEVVNAVTDLDEDLPR